MSASAGSSGHNDANGLPPLGAKGLNRARGRVPEAPDTVDPIVGGDALFETKPVALAHDDCVENPIRLPTTLNRTMQLEMSDE